MNSKKEYSALMALCSIMSIRMLGSFMILPVFSVYAEHMLGASPALIGLTLGMYGLTQAIFQIPFGAWSDHLGRKPVIIIGLCILLLGSIICALSHSIYVLLLGRALQGAGAIGSTVLAFLADLTRDESRSRAMAFMGLSIGFAFTIAMITGPVINHYFHLSGIFWAMGLLSIIGMIVLSATPTPPKPVKHSEKRFLDTLKNTQLMRLNVGIFSLHAILTALFIAIPLIFVRQLHLSEWEQVSIYVVVLSLSFAGALPFIIIAETKRKMKSVFISAIAVIFCIQLSLIFLNRSTTSMIVLLFIFFMAFTLLEATLPSLVSKIAPIRNKGAAMGVYSSAQFFGIFVGGAVGGWVMEHTHLSGIFAFCAVIALGWLLFACTMSKPPYLSTLVFPLQNTVKSDYGALAQLSGVVEVAIMSAESLLYVKIDKQKITEHELHNAMGAGNLSGV